MPEVEESLEEITVTSSEDLKQRFKDRGKKKHMIGEDDEVLTKDMDNSERMVLNFGPQHPATHGTLRMIMTLKGENIEEIEPSPGYLHTGFEKLSEHLNFNQFITVTDRMNYLSPLSNNIGFALAAEKLLDIQVPPRAQYIRVIQAELSRLADHLVSIGTHVMDLGAFTVFLYTFRQREFIYDLFEVSTGCRLTTSYTRIGGLLRDFPEGHVEDIARFCKQFRVVFDQIEGLLSKNKIFKNRTTGIGKINAEEAIAYGFTGPSLRASGVPYDLRKDEPYLIYEDLNFDIAVGTEGDVLERFYVRMEEARQSVSIIEQCLEKMPKSGEVNVEEKKIALPDKQATYGTIEGLIHHFKLIMDDHGMEVPEGEIYHATEAPNGELGWYIVSSGSNIPYKVHVRSPSIAHYAAMIKLAKGAFISDAVAILGSLNVIAGELDR